MSKTLRITHVITGLGTGGAEMMLYRLLSAMDQNEFSSRVISVTGDGPMGEKIRSLGVPVTFLDMKSVVDGPAAVKRLVRWLHENPTDVMQTWMYHADLVGSLALRSGIDIPLVWGIHNSVLDAATSKRSTRLTVKSLAYLSHSAPDVILSCSETARDEHVHLGYDAAKIRVIPNGFDLSDFRPDAAARQSLREELRLSPDTLLIGAVGRFDPQKDYPNLIAAAGWLHAARPNIHYLLCGDGLDAENATLTGWIESRGLHTFFHLLGRRNDMPRITAGLDVATSSSSYGEAFPLVVGEAMACGVPCVVTNLGDSSYLVGKTGKVVPPREPASLAAAWNALLSLPAEQRAALGAAARQRIEEHFSLPAVAGQYAALYRELAKGE